MSQIIKKIWNSICSVLIALVVLLAVLLVGVRPFGLELYVVLSGSMEPTYHTGSVIYVKEANISEVQKGDVITFFIGSDTTATHRITEVTEVEGEIAFRTKGDANSVEDGSVVSASQVVGTPVFSIPYLGYLVAYMQTPSGRYTTIAIGALLLLLIFLPDIIWGNDKELKKNRKR